MIVVAIEFYCYSCIDNMSVVNNTSIPESTLKKKSNSIVYQHFRSKCVEDILIIAYENTTVNHTDTLTKVQVGVKKKAFRDRIMFPGD